MTALDHHLDRTILICAQPDTVFRYFTDSQRFAQWWGKGSQIDPRPGGQVLICYPNGATARGEVVEIVPESHITFTYGYDDPSQSLAPGESRVRIDLRPHTFGTELHLRHELPNATLRDKHVPGWRYQLAVFGNVVAAEQHSGVNDVVDRYLRAWSEQDATARTALLNTAVAETIEFRDQYGNVCGRDELSSHIAAAQMHMGAAKLERANPVRACQGVGTFDWVVRGGETVVAKGTNIIDLAPDGRLQRIVGLWG